MKPESSRRLYAGKFLSLRIDSFRHPDGELVEREVVGHPGSVAILAHDDQHVYLVRQPREAVAEPALLELPAGKLDVEGETTLESGRLEQTHLLLGEPRRRIEALQLAPFARHQSHLLEQLTASALERRLALDVELSGRELEQRDPEPAEGERIEIVAWPLAELDAAIDACADASSLIGLLLLREMTR